MNPVIIEDSISVAANFVNDNVIVSNASLRRYLRCPWAAKGEIEAVISATGLRITLDYGANNVIGESDLRVGSDIQKTLDTLNDDWYPEEGSQLVLRANNTTGGAITLKYRITLHPLEDMPRQPDTVIMQRGPVSVANNVVDQQLLSGLRYERSTKPAYAKFHMTASAAGLTRQLLVDMISVSPPAAVAPLNRIPQDPFDKTVEGIEAPVDKLIELSATNLSGGSLNVFWRQTLKYLQ